MPHLAVDHQVRSVDGTGNDRLVELKRDVSEGSHVIPVLTSRGVRPYMGVGRSLYNMHCSRAAVATGKGVDAAAGRDVVRHEAGEVRSIDGDTATTTAAKTTGVVAAIGPDATAATQGRRCQVHATPGTAEDGSISGDQTIQDQSPGRQSNHPAARCIRTTSTPIIWIGVVAVGHVCNARKR